MDTVDFFLKLYVTLTRVMSPFDACIHILSIIGKMDNDTDKSMGLIVDLCTQNDTICEEMISIVNEDILRHDTICPERNCVTRIDLVEIEEKLTGLRRQCKQEFNGSRCDLRNGHNGYHFTSSRELRAWE